MDMHTIFTTLLSALLPVVWASVGPVATTAVTAWVNSVVGSYVPRPIQLILSSLLTAVTAGLTGSVLGLDATTSSGIGLAMGLGTQTFASISPKLMLATAPGAK